LRRDRLPFFLPAVALRAEVRDVDVRDVEGARLAEPRLAAGLARAELVGFDFEAELALARRAALRGVVARRPYSALVSIWSCVISFIGSFG
jgi:hypothetical protein